MRIALGMQETATVRARVKLLRHFFFALLVLFFVRHVACSSRLYGAKRATLTLSVPVNVLPPGILNRSLQPLQSKAMDDQPDDQTRGHRLSSGPVKKSVDIAKGKSHPNRCLFAFLCACFRSPYGSFLSLMTALWSLTLRFGRPICTRAAQALMAVLWYPFQTAQQKWASLGKTSPIHFPKLVKKSNWELVQYAILCSSCCSFLATVRHASFEISLLTMLIGLASHFSLLHLKSPIHVEFLRYLKMYHSSAMFHVFSIAYCYLCVLLWSWVLHYILVLCIPEHTFLDAWISSTTLDDYLYHSLLLASIFFFHCCPGRLSLLCYFPIIYYIYIMATSAIGRLDMSNLALTMVFSFMLTTFSIFATRLSPRHVRSVQ